MSGEPTRVGPDPSLKTGEAGDGAHVSPASVANHGGTGAPHPRRSVRGLALLIAGGVALILVIAGVAYWRANAGLIKTDNAQTAGDLAPISARIPGTVIKVNIADNQYVTAGTVLVELDPTDYQLAVDHAVNEVAVARAQVQAAKAALVAQEQQTSTAVSAAQGTLQATRPRLPQAQAQLQMEEQMTAAQVAQARARVTTARANVQAALASLETARRTQERDRQLFAQGAISAQQVDADTAAYEAALARYQAAQDDLRQAEAGLASAEAARQQVAIARGAVAVNEGEISRAEAMLRQAAAGESVVRQRAQELAAAEANAAQAAEAVKIAQINLDRALIRAPADGWVTNRTVEIGQVVQPNQPLMSVTLAHRIWVVANLKETQVGGVRVGDPVRITVDAVRGQVFHGRVQSIGAATGAATALLPPDNATGNFVKVVQLVPVRIALDFQDDPGPQLQVGLSAVVAIDTRHRTP